MLRIPCEESIDHLNDTHIIVGVEGDEYGDYWILERISHAQAG